MSVTAVKDTTAFTTEMLAQNFTTIDKHISRINAWVGDIDLGVAGLYKHLATLENRMDGLTPSAEFAKTVVKKGSKGKYLLVAGAAFYLGHHLAQKENREQFKRMYNDVMEKAQQAAKDASEKAQQAAKDASEKAQQAAENAKVDPKPSTSA